MARTATQYEKGNYLIVPNMHVVLKLRGATLNVYLAIVNYADDSGNCYPSYKRLADDTGYARRQCIKAMGELVDIGLIKKYGRARNDGGQTSNSYQLYLIHKPSDTQDTPPSELQDTPYSELEFTPKVSLTKSLYKEKDFNKFSVEKAKERRAKIFGVERIL
jgi:predicted transcriptional regulator